MRLANQALPKSFSLECQASWGGYLVAASLVLFIEMTKRSAYSLAAVLFSRVAGTNGALIIYAWL